MELVWKNLLELGFRFKNISPRSIFLIKNRNTMNKSIICFKKEFIKLIDEEILILKLHVSIIKSLYYIHWLLYINRISYCWIFPMV